MDRKLTEACKNGDLEQLDTLIRDDPYLFRAALLSDGDNPLHVACIAGHVDVVTRVVDLNPDLARELNRDGFTPLHIASARGNIDIVKQISASNPELCLVKGKENRIPLHCAVVKGRIHVVRELVSACPDSVNEVTARRESCFHLALKNHQFEAFKVLLELVGPSGEERVLNGTDGEGNTVLHVAAHRKQYEVLDMLLGENSGYSGKLEMNSSNKRGLTPLDVLISEGGDLEIEQMLIWAGAVKSRETRPVLNNNPRRPHPQPHESKKLLDYFKYDRARDSPGKARDTLLVISVLIVTATYQAVLSPPGGVWQDDYSPTSGKNETSHTAGRSVMGTHNPVIYGMFLVFNSAGFFMSLHIMNILTCGFPLQFELRVALSALIATYDMCMVAIAPGGFLSIFST